LWGIFFFLICESDSIWSGLLRRSFNVDESLAQMKPKTPVPTSFKDLFYVVSDKEDGNLSYNWGEQEGVLKARRDFFKRIGVSPADCVGMSLIHKDGVKLVDSKDRMDILKGVGSPEVDALITNEKGLYLFLLTGDCQPLIYYDSKNRVLALVHLSWKNTEMKLASKVIKTMQTNFGSNPRNVVVYIGPSIQKDSYIFSSEEIAQKDISDWSKHVEKLPNERVAIDLFSYNQRVLMDAGVPKENILNSGIDTYSSPEYFSHYRSKRTGEPEGRFATVVGIKK